MTPTDTAEVEEVVFHPRYKRRLWWSLVGMVTLVTLVPLLAYGSGERVWSDVFVALCFALLPVTLGLLLMREIRFGQRVVTIKPFLLPTLTFSYSDMQWGGLGGFRLRRYPVVWGMMKNGDELVRIIRDLEARGLITPDQFDTDHFSRDVSMLGAKVYGIPIGIAAAVGLYFLGFYPRDVPFELFALAVTTLAVGIAYLVDRRRGA